MVFFMNELELSKRFEKFCEIYESISLLESSIKLYEYYESAWEFPANKLKVICLKYKLFEIDELENIDITDKNQLLKFSEELKNSICDDLISSVKN